MFLSHFAVALASKREAPRTSLGWLVAGAQLPDLLFPTFVVLGWESMRIVGSDNPFLRARFDDYPFSHSLAMNAACAAAAGLLYWWRTRYARGAWVLSLCVVSHWFLDALTHLPDMPLFPGGPKLGLGLWSWVPATFVIEGGLFTAAVWSYATATRASDRVGRWAFITFAAFLVLSFCGAIWGPPPRSVEQFTWAAPAGLLFPLWAWWFDRHRIPRTAP